MDLLAGQQQAALSALPVVPILAVDEDIVVGNKQDVNAGSQRCPGKVSVGAGPI
jgi:hypothetical protein